MNGNQYVFLRIYTNICPFYSKVYPQAIVIVVVCCFQNNMA